MKYLFVTLTLFFFASMNGQSAYAQENDQTFKSKTSTVHTVNFKRMGKHAGSFDWNHGKEWVEKGANGEVRFLFTEVTRDELSIYLRDDERGINMQLDLHTQGVLYSSDRNPDPFKLYDIYGVK